MKYKNKLIISFLVLVIILLGISLYLINNKKVGKVSTTINDLSSYKEGKNIDCKEEICDFLNQEIANYEKINNLIIEKITINDISLNEDIIRKNENLIEEIQSITRSDINLILNNYSESEKEDILKIYNESIISSKNREFFEKKEEYLNILQNNIDALKFLNENEYKIEDNKIIYQNNDFKTEFDKFKLDISIEKEEIVSSDKKIPILMYHGVDDNVWGNTSLFVSPSIFEGQMKYLHDNGYETLFLSEIGLAKNYEKPIIITFDDGYKDMYDIAFPIMSKYQIKSSMYIITGWLDGEVYMTPEMVKSLSQSGLVEIGSHTIAHAHLASLSYEEQNVQLKESKEYLENLLGKKITTIAYPYGQRNLDTLNIAKNYYEFAVTTDSGVNYNSTYLSSALILRRLNITRNTSLDGFISLINS